MGAASPGRCSEDSPLGHPVAGIEYGHSAVPAGQSMRLTDTGAGDPFDPAPVRYASGSTLNQSLQARGDDLSNGEFGS